MADEVGKRGMNVYIWGTPSQQGLSFSPHKGATYLWVVNVPMGWSMEPDAAEGVVLRGVFASQWADARQVLDQAEEQRNGFRVVSKDYLDSAPRNHFFDSWDEVAKAGVRKCRRCELEKRPYRIENKPAGETTSRSNWGPGLPVHREVCSGCGAISGPWVSADLVGGGY